MTARGGGRESRASGSRTLDKPRAVRRRPAVLRGGSAGKPGRGAAGGGSESGKAPNVAVSLALPGAGTFVLAAMHAPDRRRSDPRPARARGRGPGSRKRPPDRVVPAASVAEVASCVC